MLSCSRALRVVLVYSLYSTISRCLNRARFQNSDVSRLCTPRRVLEMNFVMTIRASLCQDDLLSQQYGTFTEYGVSA
ncbi:hypothetical protein B0H10DRAFT_2056293 [Mycena sp. CBHHK59/15]|nr:hypothetical protein B0H10DRAFT_2056293 [Mycena sp. CBHHK59/15]